MSNEQNIDDILKLLKDSVNSEQKSSSYEHTEESKAEISAETLQSELKNQYFGSTSNGGTEKNVQNGEYSIDSDFLAELESSMADGAKIPVSESHTTSEGDGAVGVLVDERTETVSATNTESAPCGEEDAPWSDDEHDIETPWRSDAEDNVTAAEADGDEPYVEEDEKYILDDGEPAEDDVERLIADMKPIEVGDTYDGECSETDDGKDVENFSAEENSEEWLEADINDVTEKSIDEALEENGVVLDGELEEKNVDSEADELERIYEISSRESELSEDSAYTDDSDTPKITLKSDDDAPHETFLASMRKTGIDFTTDDMYRAAVGDTAESAETVSGGEADTDTAEPEVTLEAVDCTENEDIDPSTINLMLQFCEKTELEKTIGDKKLEDFLKYEQATVETQSTPAYDGKKYVDFGQNDELKRAYKKKCTQALWIMLGCALTAIAAFFYELLPLLEIRMDGVMDYHDYPAVYALIGLQFTVLAGAVCWKSLWQGLKRAFSLAPDRHSVIAMLVAVTVLYDIIVVLLLTFTGDELPATFNALAAAAVTLSAVADWLKVFSEMKEFEVYSSAEKKYTLVKESGRGSVADKMYAGGLEKDKAVWSVHHVDFPSGFFRSHGNGEKKNRILNFSIIPTAVLGIIAMIVSILLRSDAYAACAAFMICMYAVMPIALIFSDSIPYAIAAVKLAKRGSAAAGRYAAEKYSDCDVMIFDDLHIFKKCKTEEVGIAIYDTGVGYLVLGCIDALYAKLGGPLSGMQMKLPEVFKFNNADIKRITRNGAEAVIEGKHSIAVGTAEFMQSSYGLVFPANEREDDRETLCVALNGKVAAKLSVKYKTEPVFEMLAERLYAEGISVAVTTYDPLVNSSAIAASRTLGDAPISVVHKNAAELNVKKKQGYREEADGVIACSSRLKLAELSVWLKRLKKLQGYSQKIAVGFSIFGAAALTLLVIFGASGYINQLYLLIYLLAEFGAILGATLALLPKRRYFTTDRLYRELEREHMRLAEKELRGEKN